LREIYDNILSEDALNYYVQRVGEKTDEEDIPRLEQVKPAATEDVIDGPVLAMDRYHLRTSIFSGETDVEHNIAKFSDVAAICR